MSKNPQGEEEIVIQGDVGDEIVEMLRAQVGVLKGAPADQVVRVGHCYRRRRTLYADEPGRGQEEEGSRSRCIVLHSILVCIYCIELISCRITRAASQAAAPLESCYLRRANFVPHSTPRHGQPTAKRLSLIVFERPP